MQISSLRIDRFGVWNGLTLEGLQGGLNVIYGPNGSGKATIVQFIRSTIYGFSEEVRDQYIPSESTGAGGVLTLVGPLGPRVVHRYDDSRKLERLAVKREDGRLVDSGDLCELVDGVSADTFDSVFSINFLQGADVGKLVETAVARGFDVLGGDGDLMQLRELREQLQLKRRELRDLPRCDGPLDILRNRQLALQREIEALSLAVRSQQDEWEHQISAATETINRLQSQISDLKQELAAVDSELLSLQQRRQQHAEQALHQSRIKREQEAMRWQARLAEIESLRGRWQATLEEITAYREYLERVADTEVACWETRHSPSSHRVSAHTKSRLVQLEACEEQLRLAIRGLAQEQHELSVRLDHHMSLSAAPSSDESCCDCHCHQQYARNDEGGAAPDGDAKQSRLEMEAQRLDLRREQIYADIESLQRQLTENRRRCEHWQHERGKPECHALQQLRQELAAVEQNLRDTESRRDLETSIASLEREIQTVEQSVREPAVLRQAAEYLRSLTGGRLQQICISREREVTVRNGAGNRLHWDQLSQGNRDQTYLALCLALINCYANDGVRFPLILNDTFINMDVDGAKAAALLLKEFASRGHQILLFTRHQYIADLYRGLDVPVRYLPRYTAIPQEPLPEQSQQDDLSEFRTLDINSQLHMIAQENLEREESLHYQAWNSEEFPGELTDRVRQQQAGEPKAEPLHAPTSEYFLHENSPIEDAPSIDAATAERFHKIDVSTVGQLLRLDAEQAAVRLRYGGITAELIRRWQAEANLVCRVPRLRPYDARILVASGITSCQQLAELDTDSLLRRVEEFTSTSHGRSLLQSGSHYEVARLTDWIQTAKRLREAASPLGSRAGGEVERRRKPRSYRRQSRRDDAGSRTRQQPHFKQHPETSKTTPPDVLKIQPPEEELRFYLSMNDPIVDAPSIGPKTAERFIEIGIRTVAQFLHEDAETLAVRLDHRRIDAGTIRTWQKQTRLACQIPMLRGHDAQILVACGISDPATLAAADPAELWAKVEPFAETAEGKRIIRGGNPPDFEEVYNWIRWAGYARALKAA